MTLGSHAADTDNPARPDAVLDRPVFLVGCGRSGTTWLQALIAQHPRVATAPETQVFARYLGLLDRRWNQERQYRERHRVRTGIQDAIDQVEFDTHLRQFARAVLQHVHAATPSASLVLEKSPNHVAWIPLIRRCFPEARFIHLVRDPRAVVASNRAAAMGWRRHWAAAGAGGRSRARRQAGRAARAAREAGAPLYELRYEDLLAAPAAELGSLLQWLELPADHADLERYIEECRIDRLRAEPDPDAKTRTDFAPSLRRDQFFRRGTAEGWRRDLTRLQVAAVEHETGDLMQSLGYERVTSRLTGTFAAGWRRALKGLSGGLRWRVDRLLENLDDRL